MPPALSVFGVDGIGEINSGDDIAAAIAEAVAAMVAPGDILSVASKIISKAEGRFVNTDDREPAISDETVREVARRDHARGTTRIVQNRNGFVLAAAGVDASNTREGTILLLPLDPDESARKLRASLHAHIGFAPGIVITDTFGRPWRQGQTDVAIGAAGIDVAQRLAGRLDSHGRPLETTEAATADEIAGASDLVKGKTSQCPVAVVRGLAHLVTEHDGRGAAALVRPADDDMFSLGTREAFQMGYEQGRRDHG